MSTASPLAAPPRSGPAAAHPRAALAVLALCILVISLDLTILNVALPSISGALHASTAQLQWIVDSYILAFAGAMIPMGLAGDRFGRRRVILLGLTVLGISSVWSALSGSVGELIAARTLMGLGAAAVMPLALAYVNVLFPSGPPRVTAMAVMSGVVGLGLPLGPILGGFILDHSSWPTVFWINVPVAALVLVAGARLLPASIGDPDRHIDLLGAAIGVAGLVALIAGVVRGPDAGWGDGPTLALIATGLLLLIGFATRERRAAAPLIDRGLFASPHFVWGTLATVVVSFALYGVLFVVPQFLQAVRGLDAMGAGLRLVPLMVALAVGAGAAGQAERRLGAPRTIAIGLALLAAGLALLSRTGTDGGETTLYVGLIVAGAGFGATMSPAMDAALGAVPDGETGAGAAVNNTMRQIGGALGIALLGSVLSGIYGQRIAEALHGLPAPLADRAHESVVGAMAVASRIGDGTALEQAASTAFSDGMSAVLLICAGVALAGALLVLRFLPARPAPDAQD